MRSHSGSSFVVRSNGSSPQAPDAVKDTGELWKLRHTDGIGKDVGDDVAAHIGQGQGPAASDHRPPELVGVVIGYAFEDIHGYVSLYGQVDAELGGVLVRGFLFIRHLPSYGRAGRPTATEQRGLYLVEMAAGSQGGLAPPPVLGW